MAKKETATFPLSHTIIIILLIVLIGFVFMLLKKPGMKSQKAEVVAPQIISATYTCDADKSIQAQYFDNKVELELSDGRNLLLLTALSGSGVRYTNWDESVTFWNTGNTAFFQEGASDTPTFANCIQKQ